MVGSGPALGQPFDQRFTPTSGTVAPGPRHHRPIPGVHGVRRAGPSPVLFSPLVQPTIAAEASHAPPSASAPHLPQPLQGAPDLARERMAGPAQSFHVDQQAAQGLVGGAPVTEGEEQVAYAAADVEG